MSQKINRQDITVDIASFDSERIKECIDFCTMSFFFCFLRL